MSLESKIAGLRKWKQRPEILRCPPIPLPMHGLAPRVVLGNKWWNAVREEAYRSTNYHCVACEKAASVLHGHEVYDTDYLLGRMVYIETVPLCELCHQFCHQGYLRVQLEQGIITRQQYEWVLVRGRQILRDARLEPYVPYTGPTVEWGEWRLVIDDVEYEPLHKDLEAYRRYYG